MDERCERCNGFGRERDMETGATIVCRDCSGTGQQADETIPPWPKEASRPRAMSRRQVELLMPAVEWTRLVTDSDEARIARVDRWAELNGIVLL